MLNGEDSNFPIPVRQAIHSELHPIVVAAPLNDPDRDIREADQWKGPIPYNFTNLLLPVKLLIILNPILAEPRHIFHIDITKLDGKRLTLGACFRARLCYSNAEQVYYYQKDGQEKKAPLNVFPASQLAEYFQKINNDWTCVGDAPRKAWVLKKNTEKGFADMNTLLYEEDDANEHMDAVAKEKAMCEELVEEAWRYVMSCCIRNKDPETGRLSYTIGGKTYPYLQDTAQNKEEIRKRLVYLDKGKKPSWTTWQKFKKESLEHMWRSSAYFLDVKEVISFEGKPLYQHDRQTDDGVWNINNENTLVLFQGFRDRLAKFPKLCKKKDKVDDMRYLLTMTRDVLCGGNTVLYHYFMTWNTYSYLAPLDKLEKVLFAIGRTGIAKSLLEKILGNKVPGDEISGVFPNLLRMGLGQKFHNPSRGKKFAVCEEIMVQLKQNEEFKQFAYLKEQTFEEKFSRLYMAICVWNIMGSSNVVPFVEYDDRRKVVLMSRASKDLNVERLVKISEDQEVLDLLLVVLCGDIDRVHQHFDSIEELVGKDLTWYTRDITQSFNIRFKWGDFCKDAYVNKGYSHLAKFFNGDKILHSCAVRIHPFTEGAMIGYFLKGGMSFPNPTMQTLFRVCSDSLGLDTSREEQSGLDGVVDNYSYRLQLPGSAKRYKAGVHVRGHEFRNYVPKPFVNTSSSTPTTSPNACMVWFWPATDDDYNNLDPLWKNTRLDPETGHRYYPISITAVMETMNRYNYTNYVERERKTINTPLNGMSHMQDKHSHAAQIRSEMDRFYGDRSYEISYYQWHGAKPGLAAVKVVDQQTGIERVEKQVRIEVLFSHIADPADRVQWDKNMSENVLWLPAMDKWLTTIATKMCGKGGAEALPVLQVLQKPKQQ